MQPRTMALAALALAGCDRAFGLTGSGAGYTSLFVDNSASRKDLDGFPTMLAVDASTIDYSDIAAPATDLRFFDPASGEDLPFEVERWDPAGESIVWIRIGHVPAGVRDAELWMYTGSDAMGTEAPADVWAGYDLVVHGTALKNSAGATYAPTLMGARLGDGPIAQGIDFTSKSGDQRVVFANGRALFGGWPQFTLEMWMRPDYPHAMFMGEPRVLDQGGPLSIGRLLSQPTTNPDVPCKFQIDLHFAQHDAYPNVFVFTRVWTHVVFTYDGENLFLYRNGVFADIDAGNGVDPLRASSGPFELGAINNTFTGALDEIRISKTYRDPDWLFAQYIGMTRRLISFSRE